MNKFDSPLDFTCCKPNRTRFVLSAIDQNEKNCSSVVLHVCVLYLVLETNTTMTGTVILILINTILRKIVIIIFIVLVSVYNLGYLECTKKSVEKSVN